MRWTRGIAAFGIGGILLTGCSVEVKGKEISADALEQQVTQKLSETVGQRPDVVDCPEGLKGEVGKTVRCVLTAGGTKLGVTVTTTSADADSVKFDIKVDDKPTG